MLVSLNLSFICKIFVVVWLCLSILYFYKSFLELKTLEKKSENEVKDFDVKKKQANLVDYELSHYPCKNKDVLNEEINYLLSKYYMNPNGKNLKLMSFYTLQNPYFIFVSLYTHKCKIFIHEVTHLIHTWEKTIHIEVDIFIQRIQHY